MRVDHTVEKVRSSILCRAFYEGSVHFVMMMWIHCLKYLCILETFLCNLLLFLPFLGEGDCYLSIPLSLDVLEEDS